MISAVQGSMHIFYNFDTTHGRFGFHVEHIDNGLTIDGQCIETLAVRDPADLP